MWFLLLMLLLLLLYYLVDGFHFEFVCLFCFVLLFANRNLENALFTHNVGQREGAWHVLVSLFLSLCSLEWHLVNPHCVYVIFGCNVSLDARVAGFD